MRSTAKESNPFYTMVVLMGLAFVLTAGAYWMQSLSTSGRLGPPAGSAATADSQQVPLPSFMDRWGTPLLEIELAVLVTAAILAMALDRWRSRRIDRTGAQGGSIANRAG